MVNSQKRNVQKGKPHQSDSATAIGKEKTSTTSTKEEEKRSSFLFLLIVCFILIIAYTVWSSIQTYSNQLVYDME